MKPHRKPPQPDLFAPRLPKYESLAEPVKQEVIVHLARLLIAVCGHATDAKARRMTDAE